MQNSAGLLLLSIGVTVLINDLFWAQISTPAPSSVPQRLQPFTCIHPSILRFDDALQSFIPPDPLCRLTLDELELHDTDEKPLSCSATVMAAARRSKHTWTTRPTGARNHHVLFTLLALLGLLTTATTAVDPCRADFVYPTRGLKFYHLDNINVQFRSNFTNPVLTCLCGDPGGDGNGGTEQLRFENVSPFNGSLLISLSFESQNRAGDTCWFRLAQTTKDCGANSDTFLALGDPRPASDPLTTTAAAAAATTTTATITSSLPYPTAAPPPAKATDLPATAPTLETEGGEESPRGGGTSLGLGAKVGLGIGIAFIAIAVGGMALFLNFRRRKRQEATLAGAIIDHDRRHGRKGPEKSLTRIPSASVTSGRSEEPLYPIQPVFDGFPGSMGYDDVRSLDSRSMAHSEATHSPTISHNGAYWSSDRSTGTGTGRSTGRDELTAARLNSQPIIESYGPNPVTPTLTPRPSSRVDLHVRAVADSTLSHDALPDMPSIMPDYISYRIPAPRQAPEPSPEPSPPRKPAAQIVVSYGPNRVTPTPDVSSPTVPPDDTIFRRNHDQSQHQPHSPTSYPTANPYAHASEAPSERQRQYSWDAGDEMLPASQGPLPPYASTADFYAMEKGAIRKLTEPEAHELPPTKDGFYHYQSDIVEYELPGAAPQHEPQLPYHPYKNFVAAGPSGGGNGWRDIDEQKFLLSDLLSDVEMAKLRSQKAKQKAEREKAKAEAEARGEVYDPAKEETEGEGKGKGKGVETTR
ncbi:hypothetical protein B0T19DRAFT_482805 [Cercophora scortea]|uniref:Uncharacterized protein n=1 Tax=Cercophora scortea TaxID=314031 RepID=A0AAE0IWJ6_9PEZI|nr:hypothetical protein B0T19DRAFT_482805 [Cercophora scortea]